MFVIICKECNAEYEIKEENDIFKSPIFTAGYGGEIGLKCDKCNHVITEGEPYVMPKM